MYVRYLTAAHLKKNFFEYEGFVGDVPEFCAKEVETPDMECDQPQIMAITAYFALGVEINSITPTGKIEVIRLPLDGYDGFRPQLIFVPGHYECLYE
jgi:hypothetical protein